MPDADIVLEPGVEADEFMAASKPSGTRDKRSVFIFERKAF